MKISVQEIDGMWVLMVQTPNAGPELSRAGTRLLKAEPHPQIDFEHFDSDDAKADAEKLQGYLDKKPNKLTRKNLC